MNRLSNALIASQVKCVDENLILDGQQKSAISYKNPDRTEVHFSRWSASSRLAKQALVLHEGLVLIGVEKTDDYHISSVLAGVSLRAAMVDVTCFLDIQDLQTGEHVQEASKLVTLKAGDHQLLVLLRSKNYAIKISPAGGLMLLFYRMDGASVLETLGTSVIPATDGKRRANSVLNSVLFSRTNSVKSRG